MSKNRHKYGARRDDNTHYNDMDPNIAHIMQQKSKREERRMIRVLKTKSSRRDYDDDYYGDK